MDKKRDVNSKSRFKKSENSMNLGLLSRDNEEKAKNPKFLVIFVIFLFGILLFVTGFVFAEDLNLKINGQINNYSSDVLLKSYSLASSGIDNYDMYSSDSPSDYAQFYSNVSSKKLSIDSWDGSARLINLVYSMSNGQTGTLNFSWTLLNGSYDGAFYYYGNDSSYTTAIESGDMRSLSSYLADLSGESKVYMRVSITNYSSPAGATSPGGGGSVITNPFWKKTIYETWRGYFVSKIISLSERERVVININGKYYTIGILKLGYDYSIIYIDGIPPINETFVIGDSRKYDFNNDNYYDIDLELISFNYNQAQLRINEINESIWGEGGIKGVNQTAEDDKRNKTSQATLIIQNINKLIDKYNLIRVVWGGLIVIMILMGILIIIAVKHIFKLREAIIRRR